MSGTMLDVAWRFIYLLAGLHWMETLSVDLWERIAVKVGQRLAHVISHGTHVHQYTTNVRLNSYYCMGG